MFSSWGYLATIGRLGNRNIRAAPRHTRFPNQPQQEGIRSKPLDQVGICDIRTAERYQIRQTFCDKVIAAMYR